MPVQPRNANDSQQLSEASREACDRFFPHRPEKESTDQQLCSCISSMQNCETINFI